jgi:hypothetical protein
VTQFAKRTQFPVTPVFACTTRPEYLRRARRFQPARGARTLACRAGVIQLLQPTCAPGLYHRHSCPASRPRRPCLTLVAARPHCGAGLQTRARRPRPALAGSTISRSGPAWTPDRRTGIPLGIGLRAQRSREAAPHANFQRTQTKPHASLIGNRRRNALQTFPLHPVSNPILACVFKKRLA